MLFVIGFIGISLKQRPHQSPINNHFIFVMIITKNRCFASEALLCVELGPYMTATGLRIIDTATLFYLCNCMVF